MDRNDQNAIAGLFSKLALVEQQTGQRDPESERFIQERINRQPGAPYYMAQTIVVQEQALEAAQRRIEELERQTSQEQQRSSGGFFSSVFGNGAAPARPSPPASLARPASASPWGGQTRDGSQQGSGFLAGAAQTAMGVAGGVLLGNAIMGMMGGSDAQAAEPEAVEPDAEAPADDFDFGGDEII